MRGPVPSSWTPYLLRLFRIVCAFLFTAHGTQKLFGAPSVEVRHPVTLMSLTGLPTRPVAFVLSGEMAVAYFLRHGPQGFWPIRNRGELVVLYCFLFLYLASAGPGPWSLDAWRDRWRASP